MSCAVYACRYCDGCDAQSDSLREAGQHRERGVMSAILSMLLLYRRVDVSGRGSVETVVQSVSPSTIDGLAVDWIAHNIYWTDAGIMFCININRGYVLYAKYCRNRSTFVETTVI